MLHDTFINEPIKVWVFFNNGIFPVAMNWRNRLIKFKKLIFANTKRIGETKIISLVCTSDTANFELEYNTESHLWKLKKAMAKE